MFTTRIYKSYDGVSMLMHKNNITQILQNKQWLALLPSSLFNVTSIQSDVSSVSTTVEIREVQERAEVPQYKTRVPK